MVVGNALDLHGTLTIILSVGLAFLFGYGLSMLPLLRHGLGLRRAMQVAFAADTASITTMEFADNIFMLAVPGAMTAGLTSGLFWASLAASLVVAFFVALPVNRWLISRGKGHAIAHKFHHHDHHSA